jgi:hypothetical protein
MKKQRKSRFRYDFLKIDPLFLGFGKVLASKKESF